MTVKPQGVVSDGQPGAREGQAGRRGVAEGFVVLMSPGIQRCSLFRGVGRSQAENCWSDIKSVTRWIVDRRVLHLLKMWLECPVEETDKRGRKTRTTEAKDNSRGIPQGSPIAPLLANLYMRRFVLGWKKLGLEQSLGTRIVTHADVA